MEQIEPDHCDRYQNNRTKKCNWMTLVSYIGIGWIISQISLFVTVYIVKISTVYLWVQVSFRTKSLMALVVLRFWRSSYLLIRQRGPWGLEETQGPQNSLHELCLAQIQIPIPNKYLGCGYKGLIFCRNNGGKHGQRTHSTKMGADKSTQNTPNAPKFICSICLLKPKSSGLEWKKASLGVRSPW